MGSFIKSTGTGISGTLDFIGNRQNVNENKTAITKETDARQQGINEARMGADAAVSTYQPYQELAPQSLALLQSALMGGEVSYQDPSVKPMTQQEWIAEQWRKMQAGEIPINAGYQHDIERGEDPLARLSRSPIMQNEYNSKKWYKSADGTVTDKAPTLTASYKPQESTGFQYTKDRTLADLGRSLRMMGRGSGTVAANSYGRTLGELNAANEQQQYQRLGDLVGLGQFGTQGTAGAYMTKGNTLAGLYSGLGASLGQGYRNLGLARKEFWGDQAKWNYQGASDAGDGLNEYFSMKSGGGGGMGGGGFGG